MSDSTLKELWQQVAEKKSCEAKQKELTAQRNALADRLKKLEKSKLAEQADVDRLEGHSLAAFFYQVIGKMDEKLDKERQEAYAARVKYDAALHDLSSVDADLEQIQNRLERLSDCERQYQAALSEKIKSINAYIDNKIIRDILINCKCISPFIHCYEEICDYMCTTMPAGY